MIRFRGALSLRPGILLILTPCCVPTRFPVLAPYRRRERSSVDSARSGGRPADSVSIRAARPCAQIGIVLKSPENQLSTTTEHMYFRPHAPIHWARRSRPVDGRYNALKSATNRAAKRGRFDGREPDFHPRTRRTSGRAPMPYWMPLRHCCTLHPLAQQNGTLRRPWPR